MPPRRPSCALWSRPGTARSGRSATHGTPRHSRSRRASRTRCGNLPEELQHKKMTALHEAIERHLKVVAVSFRCGRWGYSESVARNLAKLGYKVDTSITPFTDWGAVGGPDFSEGYTA